MSTKKRKQVKRARARRSAPDTVRSMKAAARAAIKAATPPGPPEQSTASDAAGHYHGREDRRTALIAEHRKAIAGAEAMRERMGDKWADNTIAARRKALRELGIES